MHPPKPRLPEREGKKVDIVEEVTTEDIAEAVVDFYRNYSESFFAVYLAWERRMKEALERGKPIKILGKSWKIVDNKGGAISAVYFLEEVLEEVPRETQQAEPLRIVLKVPRLERALYRTGNGLRCLGVLEEVDVLLRLQTPDKGLIETRDWEEKKRIMEEMDENLRKTGGTRYFPHTLAAGNLALNTGENLGMDFLPPFESPRMFFGKRAAAKIRGETPSPIPQNIALNPCVPFVAQEYVEWPNVRAVLPPTGTIERQIMVLQIMREVANAMFLAHFEGIAFKDFKPGIKDDRVKVAVDEEGVLKMNERGEPQIRILDWNVSGGREDFPQDLQFMGGHILSLILGIGTVDTATSSVDTLRTFLEERGKDAEYEQLHPVVRAVIERAVSGKYGDIKTLRDDLGVCLEMLTNREMNFGEVLAMLSNLESERRKKGEDFLIGLAIIDWALEEVVKQYANPEHQRAIRDELESRRVFLLRDIMGDDLLKLRFATKETIGKDPETARRNLENLIDATTYPEIRDTARIWLIVAKLLQARQEKLGEKFQALKEENPVRKAATQLASLQLRSSSLEVEADYERENVEKLLALAREVEVLDPEITTIRVEDVPDRPAYSFLLEILNIKINFFRLVSAIKKIEETTPESGRVASILKNNEYFSLVCSLLNLRCHFAQNKPILDAYPHFFVYDKSLARADELVKSLAVSLSDEIRALRESGESGAIAIEQMEQLRNLKITLSIEEIWEAMGEEVSASLKTLKDELDKLIPEREPEKPKLEEGEKIPEEEIPEEEIAQELARLRKIINELRMRLEILEGKESLGEGTKRSRRKRAGREPPRWKRTPRRL